MSFERQLIGRVLAGDRQAGAEFAASWAPEIKNWIAQRAPHEKVDDHCQLVWESLATSDWQAFAGY